MTTTDPGTRAPVYAGIGSRTTPPGVLAAMTRIAKALAAKGWVLHSGGADGADQAFAAGAPAGARTIYLPWPRYNGLQGAGTVVLDDEAQRDAQAVVSTHHPAWHRCGRGARALHGRNHAIIHGVKGTGSDRRVDAVICWTPERRLSGGTATGIRMARAAGIPVLNMARCTEEQVLASLGAIGRLQAD